MPAFHDYHLPEGWTQVLLAWYLPRVGGSHYRLWVHQYMGRIGSVEISLGPVRERLLSRLFVLIELLVYQV